MSFKTYKKRTSSYCNVGFHQIILKIIFISDFHRIVYSDDCVYATSFLIYSYFAYRFE
jgi:hypothetical protein